MSWHLDEILNVPYCQGDNVRQLAHWKEDGGFRTVCNACAPYLRHCRAAYAGFSDDEAYLADWQRQQTEKEEKNKPPVIIVDDLEVNHHGSHSRMEGHTEKAAHPPVQAPDQGLIQHMQFVSQLQSIHGRSVINKFQHKDPGAVGRLRGVLAMLQQTETSAKTSLDEAKARLVKLREAFQSETEELRQLRSASDTIEDARSRKVPTGREPIAGQEPAIAKMDELVPLVLSSPDYEPTILDILKRTPFDAHQLHELRKKLITMKAPPYHQPAEAYAKWLQFHENKLVKGVPTRGPDWVVDLRDVRGRNEVLSRVPPGPPIAKTRDQRRNHAVILLAVLRVLAIPGAYLNILERTHTQVATEVDLSCKFPSSPQSEPPSEEDVVQTLASQGLTVETADDAWQFVYKFLEAHATENTQILGPTSVKELLKLIHERVEAVGRPAGTDNRTGFLRPPPTSSTKKRKYWSCDLEASRKSPQASEIKREGIHDVIQEYGTSIRRRSEHKLNRDLKQIKQAARKDAESPSWIKAKLGVLRRERGTGTRLDRSNDDSEGRV
ncbi:hypothetical protein B0H11DRAFT_1905126 [Mycena galericulata]|nr:hypothetical protein B0H11DRAFT_1905126 [Mycena galericulata]